MNIALVIWQLDTYGGSIRQILEEARFLQKQGHTVDVFTYKVDKEKCFPEFISMVHVLAPQPISLKQIFYNQSDSLTKRIWAFLVNEVVQYLQVQAVGDVLALEHKKKHYDAINYHDHGVYRLAPRFTDTKNVWMMNDPPSFIDAKEKDASQYAQTFLMKLLAWVERKRTLAALTCMDTIVVLDERNKSIVQRHFGKDARIVRSGLSIDQKYRSYKSVSELKKEAVKKLQTRTKTKNADQIHILTTNIFFRHRRYEDLIEAANILVHEKKKNNVIFRIIGDPTPDMGYYHMIQSLVQKYALEKNVLFLGRVDEKELELQYQIADIFVFPNHNQTWGLSVFEAMLRGAAVVVSKTSGAHDVLTDGKNALLVSPKDPQDLANKLEYVVTKSDVRVKLSKSGHAFVIKHISWEKYASDMAQIFSQK